MKEINKIFLTVLTPVMTVSPLVSLASCGQKGPTDPTAFKDMLLVSTDGICSGFKAGVTQKQIDNVITSAELTFPKGIVTFSENAFDNLGGTRLHFPSCVTKIILPEGLVSISAYAFRANKSIKTIQFNNELTTIGESSFASCEAIDKLEFNEGLRTIRANAFTGCSSLTEVKLPTTITSIEQQAFYNCTKLATIDTSHFENSIVWKKVNANDEYDGYYDVPWTQGNEAFANIASEGQFIIKKGTALVLANLFVWSISDKWTVKATEEDFTTINVENGVLKGFKAGSTYDDKLQELCTGFDIENITEIATNAFNPDAWAIESEKADHTIPQAIEKETAGVQILRFVDDKCQKIGANAFNGCKSINVINVDALGDVPATWDAHAFSNMGASGIIYVRSPYETSWQNYFTGCGFSFGENNWQILVDTVLNIDVDSHTGLVTCYGFKDTATEEEIKKEFGTKLSIPANVQAIADNAFYDETNNKSKLPDTCIQLEFGQGSQLREIGKNAFRKSQFVGELTLTCLTLGANAFYENGTAKVGSTEAKGLTKINFANSCNIDTEALASMNALTSVKFIKTPTIKNKVFNGSSLLATIDTGDFDGLCNFADGSAEALLGISENANIIISDNTDRVAAWNLYSTKAFNKNNMHTITYKTKGDNFCVDISSGLSKGLHKKWVQDPCEQHIYDEGGNFWNATDGKKVEWNSAGFVGGSWIHKQINKQQFEMHFTYLNKYGVADLGGSNVHITTSGIQEVWNEKSRESAGEKRHYGDHKIQDGGFKNWNLDVSVNGLAVNGNTGYAAAWYNDGNTHRNFHQSFGVAGSGWGRAWWYGWKITDNQNGNYTLTLDVTCYNHGHAIQGHLNDFDTIDMYCQDSRIHLTINKQ